MNTEVIVAALGLAGTLAGSFLGVVAAGKVTDVRLKQLEEKVNRHNNLVERTYILEGQVAEAIHEIKDLKAFHMPGR